jgi:uncharacterized protein (DUF2141 family)
VAVPLVLSARAGEQRPALRFDVTNLRSDRGAVGCALYRTEAEFFKTAFRTTFTPVVKAQNGPHAVCVFDDLVPGTYAMAAFHDENGNGKLDANFLGIPKEGVCASNNAKGRMGPPKFKDAAIQYQGALVEQQLRVKYLF